MHRFPLLRYYVIVSFVVIAIGAVVLALLLNDRAEGEFIARSEEQGSTEVGHTLQMFYYNVLSPQLAEEPNLSIQEAINTDMLDMFARRTTFGLNVTGIHMFDPEGNTVYSSEPEEAGLTHVAHGWQYAADGTSINETNRPLLLQALEGTANANLVTGSEITDLDGNTRNGDAVLSYTAIMDTAPDSGQQGRVLGVLSISQDVTDAFSAAKADALRNSIIASVGLGGGLFLVLFLVVLKADGTIAAGHRRIQAQQETLEQEVDERKQAEEGLERSNADLEEFTYSVSHDLKEPLRGIQAFSAFLAEDYKDDLDEEGQRYIQVLGDSAVRMKHLIDDLLELSRVGRTKEAPVPTDVGPLLEDLRRDLEFTLKEKNVDLRIQPDLPTITCEKVRIRMVFQNLISNAIKFNDKAQPVVEIGCSQDDDATTFFVRDDGMGIDEQHYDRIFSIFQRLNRREDYDGTGIGLALCKRAVEGFGGRMWIESKSGEGSTFFFSIPRTIQREAPASEQPDATVGAEQLPNAEGADSPIDASPTEEAA